MASIRLSGMRSGRNLYSPLPGALVPSPSHGGGLRAPFFFGRGVAGMADHTRQHAWIAPFFPRSVFHDVPVYPCFLVRPQLLTRVYLLPMGRGIPWSTLFPCISPADLMSEPAIETLKISRLPSQSTELTKERGVWGLRPSFWVAERSRHGDRSRRSWHPKNQRILSVIVMLVTGTGDKVVYCLGRSKGRARSPTACGGPTRGRRGARSQSSDVFNAGPGNFSGMYGTSAVSLGLSIQALLPSHPRKMYSTSGTTAKT